MLNKQSAEMMQSAQLFDAEADEVPAPRSARGRALLPLRARAGAGLFAGGPLVV